MEKFKIKSNYDGLEIKGLIVKPTKNIKGIVQIAHGMAEHKERYIPFMKCLASKGYVAIINDHRGHGESVKDKEDLGYFYDDNAEALVDDLKQVTGFIKEKYPSMPICLFGHSMGSMVVRKYIEKYDIIDKLIVSGSPSYNKSAMLAIWLVKFMKFFKGDKYRSKFINRLAFKNYNIGYTIDNSWLSQDLEVVSTYNQDELCGFIFTLNGFLNLFTLMKDTYNKRKYIANNKDLPILFIAGACDPVIMSKEKWDKAQEFLKEVGFLNVRGKLYPMMRHELLNEINKEEVYQDIVNFLDD